MRRGCGFTLVEMLVALAVFTLMTGIAYRGLDAVLNAQARLDGEDAKWRRLSVAFVDLGRSLGAAVDPPLRDGDAPAASGFVARTASLRDDAMHLAFVRMGPSGAQRVAYRLRQDRLERLEWPSVERTPAREPSSVELLTGIRAMELRCLARDGTWHPVWPPAGASGGTVPAAVEVRMRLGSGEELTRLFDLP